MASKIAPAIAHPDLLHLRAPADDCAAELAELGAQAREQNLRLSFHAPMVVQLAALDSEIADRAITILDLLATLLDAMALDHDAVIVVHVGGLRGDANEAIGRWVGRWERLPAHVQRRVVLEHEDDGASLPVALRVHAATGVPVVFDHLHWCLNNPEGWPADVALAAALATWSHDRTPKIHFSSPRTELQAVEREDAHGKRRWRLRPPRPGRHADFLNPWEFGVPVRSAAHLRDFDVMLEAKASDVALLRLRRDLAHYVPDVAAWIDGGVVCKQP